MSRRRVRQAERYREALELAMSLPAEARAAVGRIADEIIDIGNRLQLPPEQMLAALATIAAGVLLCNGGLREEELVNRRIGFTLDALHAVVAVMRLNSGAIGPRPDGSFGIRGEGRR